MAEELDWERIRTRLQREKKEKLVAVIEDLYRQSSANQLFLAGRYLNTKQFDKKGYKRYRQQVIGLTKTLAIVEAHDAVKAYEQASGDKPGTIDLLIVVLAKGFGAVAGMGVHDGAFAYEMAQVVNDLAGRLSVHDDIYGRFEKRLVQIYESKSFGIAEGLYDLILELMPESYLVGDETEDVDEEWS